MKVFFRIILIFFICQTSTAISEEYPKPIAGRIEKISFPDKNIAIDAKLDTGADMSSLSAIDIKILPQERVSFTVQLPAQKIHFSAHLAGFVHIIKREHKRPVIYLWVRLGNQQEHIRVNLVDRNQFTTPMLLGRDAIAKFNLLIDVSKKYQVRKEE